MQTAVAKIVAAYVGHHQVAVAELPVLIRNVHAAVASPRKAAPTAKVRRRRPAVPVGRSVRQSYIVCLEDGQKFKTLKRHLRTAHNLSPEDYRAKWGLESGYPMVSQRYSAKRAALASKTRRNPRRRRPSRRKTALGESAAPRHTRAA